VDERVSEQELQQFTVLANIIHCDKNRNGGGVNKGRGMCAETHPSRSVPVGITTPEAITEDLFKERERGDCCCCGRGGGKSTVVSKCAQSPSGACCTGVAEGPGQTASRAGDCVGEGDWKKGGDEGGGGADGG
jgi:hypothetical protein